MFVERIEGLEEAIAILRELPARLRRKAIRQALRSAAKVVQQAARQNAPVLSATSPMVRRGYRRPGTLRTAIRVRSSRQATQMGNIGVFVNVKPAPKASRGAKNPRDPYYWRWVEFGTSRKLGPTKMPLRRASQLLPQAAQVFERELAPRAQALATNPKVDP